ncbi:tetratricopeptide repeat-containing protein [Massilia terrae]|uniref:Tetratricopeptide repeat-containing protein n=1 Tax=Massilia terrae TaxID=1811224 RepID=A0ABT2CV75_9BURK|nr:tetratricopeptide repeat-containing protein [Massilia terrae]MCS0657862.1 tetratricopeptide repeat-containing protein [Massilia terrae]
MEINRITLPPISAPGAVTTFYSYESGTARSVALCSMAVLLASRQNATVPVLMIDWDTEAPALHQLFGRGGQRPGVLEYFGACREQLDSLARTHPEAGDEERAQLALEAIDWEAYIERVDDSRPLYLMRAGVFDDSYGERADRMDWDGLFAACPALFRGFAAHLAQHFQHVLVDARGGRSAAVSVCTTLLPDKLVGLFTPNQRSLDGMAGVVMRAIDYRCSHEEEQRPLLVYPLPCAVDSGDSARRMLWRRGDPHKGVPGYQAALEQLLRACYGLARLSLDSYLDEVQLQLASATAGGEHLGLHPEADPDRFSLTRSFETLLAWVAPGRFPWQARAEIELLAAVEAARAGPEAGADAAGVALARDLAALGALYREQGRARQAQELLEESLALRQRQLGNDAAETRCARAALAALLRDGGKLDEARFMMQMLVEDSTRVLGADHPDTLAAGAALAATLARLGDVEQALELQAHIADSCEARHGAGHMATLDSVAAQADTLRRKGELSRARALYERVLEGRQRLLGTEHEDTLRCTEQLAALLCELGDLAHARKLQEDVLRARERHAGHDAAATTQAREVLAEIFAAQGDLDAVRGMQETLAQARARRFGPAPPDAPSVPLRLAARIEESVQQVSRGLQAIHSIPSGPHEAFAPGQRHTLADLGELGAGESLDDKLAQLQRLIDNRSAREARALADSLRKVILRPSVAHPLRRRGAKMIKQVYLQNEDKDAWISFKEEEVTCLEGALFEAGTGRPLAMR